MPTSAPKALACALSQHLTAVLSVLCSFPQNSIVFAAMAALVASGRRLGGIWSRLPAAWGVSEISTSSPDQAHPKPTPLPKLKDSFLDGTSSTYLEELEERYQKDPSSVDKTWAGFFGSLGTSAPVHQ